MKVVRFIPVIALALTACAPRITIRSLPPSPLTGGWGIAVYPLNLELQASPYESYSRGDAIAEHLAETTDLRVYGPGELEVRSFDTDNVYKGTDLISRVHFTKQHQPEGFYAIRVTVRQRVSIGSASAIDPRTGETSSRKEETIDISVCAELLSMARRDVIAELDAETSIDPFAIETGADQYPEMTRLTQALVDELVHRTGLGQGRPPSLDLRVATVPRPALDYAPSGEPADRGDALDLEARLLHIIQEIDPDAPRDRERLYRHEPYGLVVLGASGAAASAGLQVGVFLQEANGDRLLGRFVLLRALEDGPVRLRLKRGGEERELSLFR